MQETTTQSGLLRALEDARRRLVDTGRRNKLIHTPRDAKRTNSLAVFDANSDEVFHALVYDRKKLTFRATLDLSASDANKTNSAAGSLVTERQIPRPESRADELQTKLSSESLQKRLLRLFRDAKSSEDEQGVNILYLAIGFLSWFESENSEVACEAPLILVPVSLVRDSARSSFRLVFRDDEISENLPLQERLRDDFGIDIPVFPEGEEFSPSAYFSKISQAISSEPKWSIDPTGIMLGFFSFSKFLMFRDLQPENWPDGALDQHPLIGALLRDGFAKSEPLFAEDCRLDEIFSPADLMHVVDADASQTLAIETVRRGRDLVVQGPPGTGKSQTITNIIADAVYSGKTVLFLSEKMAALDVVHKRLRAVGLGDVCLELHSRKANKRNVLLELDRTLRSAAHPNDASKTADRLKQVRDQLNSDAARLNTPVMPCGITPYRALGRQVQLSIEGYKPPKLKIADATKWSEEKAREVIGHVKALADATSEFGCIVTHPWRGVRNLYLQPPDRQRLRPLISDLSKRVAILIRALSAVAPLLEIPSNWKLGELALPLDLFRRISNAPRVPSEYLRVVLKCKDLETLNGIAGLGLTFGQACKEAYSSFSEKFWSKNLVPIRKAIEHVSESWFPGLRSNYRKASNELSQLLNTPLPKKASERLALVDLALRVQKLRSEFDSQAAFASAALGNNWLGYRTNFSELSASTAWALSILKQPLRVSRDGCLTLANDPKRLGEIATQLEIVASEVDKNIRHIFETLDLDVLVAFGIAQLEEITIEDLVNRGNEWLDKFDQMDDWGRLNLSDEAVRQDGLSDLADWVAIGTMRPEHAVGEVEYARSEAIWKSAVLLDPALGQLDGKKRSQLVEEFKSLEKTRQESVAREIATKHASMLPRGGAGEISIVRGEIARQRGHMPIRKLAQRAGRVLQNIKPVFLMSPLSVAQFLPPGALKFDLLVIDEASQVRPEDALGAVVRAKQILIVGDKKQLPPTSFFDRLSADDDSDDDELDTVQGVPRPVQLESILSLSDAQGLTQQMLRWHYRSRHPSLIAVSNDQFYDGKLFLPPSPMINCSAQGLILNRVNGAYDRGGTRTNEIEAKALVSAVVLHASSNPNLSLGVATFSIPQKELIENLLEVERRKNHDLDAFMQRSGPDEMFVKNLENVQGDERDVIMISIGYGPRTAGLALDSMVFGPVSADGGERRLNVLFTRAKICCRIFVSFDSGHIDTTKVANDGPRILQRFLRYAETGHMDIPTPTGAGADSPFEEAVAKMIRTLGYRVDMQVGSVGFKIDLAVIDPMQSGRYLLAIECDGATYHSGRWARERDCLRQNILEDQGWVFHRIWSTDWFRNAANEQRKLINAIEAAKFKLSTMNSTSSSIVPASLVPADLPI